MACNIVLLCVVWCACTFGFGMVVWFAKRRCARNAKKYGGERLFLVWDAAFFWKLGAWSLNFPHNFNQRQAPGTRVAGITVVQASKG